MSLPDEARFLVRSVIWLWAGEDRAPYDPLGTHPRLEALFSRREAHDFWIALSEDLALADAEWRTLCRYVEVGFASGEYGFAEDIAAVSGLDDEAGIRGLRALQAAVL